MIDQPFLDDLLARTRAEFGVPGAQLAVHTPQGRWQTVVGDAGPGRGPVTTDTAFPLGSLTKPATATLAMMLLDDGDLELDEPLAEYLPELGGPAAGRTDRLTVRGLLSHTGGLASDVAERTLGTRQRSRWVADHLREADLVHRPGSVFSYSNVGYLLLGHLVEQLTGVTWREAVDTMLLAPLGITPAFVLAEPPDRTIACGHTHRDGRAVPIERQALPIIEEPAGGLALSAADLAVLAGTQLTIPTGPTLLSAAARSTMATDQLTGMTVPPGIADGWALGWAVYRDTATEWLGHDGTANGGSCHLRFDPRARTVVAFTSNAGTGIRMWDRLVEELRAAGIPVGHTPLFGPAPELDRIRTPDECVGRFVNGDNEIRVLRGPGGVPTVSLDGPAQAELVCFSDLRFEIRQQGPGMSYPGRFVRDPVNGSIDLLQLAGRVARRHPLQPETMGSGERSAAR
ncbi:hypothetical protein ALI22I_17675 [Saccharothrix sp. ALI-22-I]|uniref:serine hydrolase domain-containing protein n=1 Tax=Saccharothrix sp. ALI-22-I TaxID=1933778 RepID=UPI00097C93A8|nr:serine hydrolase domain-containing protein [Saccharothrix sp. ALI-22-I]ONI88805.1 hypothetical protein ALI22I_17675 [Saccharothrix sp. ALI-22-I]